MYCSICKIHYKKRSEFGTREKRKSAIERKCKKCKEKKPICRRRYDSDDEYQKAMVYVESRWEREYDEENYNSRYDDYGYDGDSYEI